MEIHVNGERHPLPEHIEAETPLLWVLRDEMGLVGAKYGCGIGQCGACTVHLNGEPIRSCLTPVGALGQGQVTTIEGLASYGVLTAVQQAWIDTDVPQCGYCQAGQVMAASALLSKTPNPSDEEINSALAGNLCRCGTYMRIKAAIKTASASSLTPQAQAEASS